jgi:hypothetical protein
MLQNVYRPLTHWNSGGLLAGFPQPGQVNNRKSASIFTRLSPLSITQVGSTGNVPVNSVCVFF